MKSPIGLVNRKQSASLKIVSSLLAIAPLFLVLVAANLSGRAQTSDAVSNASTAPSPADWSQFLRDNMQRWNPYETVLGVNNVGSLQVKWKNPIGIYNSSFGSSPTVVNGVVYFGSDDGNVYALNASTGANLWSFKTGSYYVRPSPAVANGVVYISSDNLDALNANTGAKLWTYAAAGNSPTVANGVVYFGGDAAFYALNASTGAKLWSFETGVPSVLSSPAVANGMVYFIDKLGNIYALNVSTGAVLWKYATGDYACCAAAVANGVVYIGGAHGILYALNAMTGAKLWSYVTQGTIDTPAVANGVVYIGSWDGNIYALNAITGVKLWSYYTGPYLVESSPAVANGVVYITNTDSDSADGILYALNASTGAKLWSYNVGYLNSSPAIVDGVLYIRGGGTNHSSAGNTYAFALGGSVSADLFLRIKPSANTVHQGDLLTFAFPVWNLGPDVAEGEVLSSLQVPAGTTFDYIRISGTPGLGTCTHPPYGGTGQIVCHEGDGMAPNTTWTVRLTVKVTACRFDHHRKCCHNVGHA